MEFMNRKINTCCFLQFYNRYRIFASFTMTNTRFFKFSQYSNDSICQIHEINNANEKSSDLEFSELTYIASTAIETIYNHYIDIVNSFKNAAN